MPLLDLFARALTALFALDRLVKLAAAAHFFRREPPPAPAIVPSLTLIQPVTRGAADLRGALAARLALDYSAPVQHLVICDAADGESQAVCRELLAAQRAPWGELVLVEEPGLQVATKVTKLRAALPLARGEVLCFVDDDVLLRPGSLQVLLRYLLVPDVGAVFGLACYVNWRNLPSSLMSAFVNANALLSYIPISYLTEPFTITGHCFALRRDVFERIGGLEGMEGRIDDDHELARRCRRAGLRLVQTPLVYDVINDLPTLHAYAIQMRRWFVFPKQAMLPLMSGRDRALTLLSSLGNFIPGLLALLALLIGRRAALQGALASLGLFSAAYLWCERRYLGRITPGRSWPLLPLVATLAPFQALWALWGGDEVVWRGQRLRVQRGGRVEASE